MKILIADDSPIFRHLVEATLVKRGYETITVSNGIEAFSALQQPDAPALAVLDVTMPGMDGTVVAETLQEDQTTSHIPIVFLTSLVAGTEVRKEGPEIGGRLFLAKPFDLGELLAIISMALKRA